MPGEAKPVQIDIHMREKVATRPDTKHSEEAHQPSSPLKAASSNLEQNYDAFLSFRGTDVRKNFLGHLYAALDQKGIYTYVDSEELRKGERITPALIKAIEDSRIAIIIFSEDYASSLWCLEEVEKIMECKEQRGLKVFPVFYKVDPREVRTPRESYRKAMDKHERKFGRDSEKVKRWKKALFDAGSLSGWDLKDKDEADLIKRIVQGISMQLDRTPLQVAKHPVGIPRQVVKLKSMLNLASSDDVLMIGLWGQGGIGKTTLAKALYNDIFKGFEASCFLANVRETSKDSKDLVHLQEKLLSEILVGKELTMFSVDGGINLMRHRLCRKRVLIVLDDVDNVKQLNALAGGREWFGKGSRIIITTRDNHLLTVHGIDEDHIYEVKTLVYWEALELFNKHAFLGSKEIVIRRDLLDSALHYAKGLPLALEVLGSFLCGRREQEWESALNKLAKSPDKTINDVLKLSYDGLEDYAKEIFLDIACFFKGRSIEHIMEVLNSCDFDTTIGVRVLVEKSLITEGRGTIQMHDLIQLMGMDIVKQECHDDPGRRSRLWLCEDVCDVLSGDMGTNAIKAIVLVLPKTEAIYIDPNAFTNMKRLRLLIMINVHNSFQGPIYLPNELRWFQWPECPFSVLKFPSGPKKLVRLDLCKSNIQVLVGQFKDFKNLKFLYLSECLSMVCMPNLDFCPNLEELDLSGCKNLKHAHEAVAYHAKLRLLNLRGCSNLHHLPDILQPKNLQVLNLRGCSKLRRFPDIPNKMKCLQRLFLDETSIEELPASMENLVSLEILSISYCKKLANLPSIIYKLPNLWNLWLVCCSKLNKFPKEEESSDLHSKTGFPKLGFLELRGSNLQEVEFLENHSCFPSLMCLDLRKNFFAKLLECMGGHLHHLLELNVSERGQLQESGEVSPARLGLTGPRLGVRQLLQVIARNCESLSKIPPDILSINRLFRDPVRSERSWKSYHGSYCETILPGGEMPQWLLPNKEGYISFKVSKDLYEKFLKLAIGVVLRVKEGLKEGKPKELMLSLYTNGRCEHEFVGPRRFPISYTERVLLQLHAIKDLWGVDPFGRNDSISFRLGIKASNAAIVKKCGFRLICKPLEDNLEALNQDDELLDPSLVYEIWHHNEEKTGEEEISADLLDLEKRPVDHEDNYQTNSEEGDNIRPKKKKRKDDDMDNYPLTDMMADFSVELSLNEDNHQSRSEADGTSERETDKEILGDMSWSDLSVEKCRYSEIAPYYMNILPGGDMPEEFIIVEGNTISFMVSQDFYDKFLGLALCVVFTVEDGEKEIFFDIVPHLNGQKRNGLSGSLGSFNSNHMWIQYLKPNVLWGVLEGAVDFLEFDNDCLRFSLTLSVSGGIIKKLGYVLRCKQMDDDLKDELGDKQLVNLASIYEMKFEEFFYKFLSRQKGQISKALRPLETVSAVKEIANVIDGFKKQVAADRAVIIKKRIEENRRKLARVTEEIFNSSKQRNDHTCDNIAGNSEALLKKMQADALGMLNGINANNGDRDSNNYLEDAHGSTPVLLGSSIPAKNAVRTIKLPEVKRLLPFTTWIFLDRNQRMTEDQSVVGRRRIYYDQNGGEALICSDSEEEAIEEEEDKREFVDSEDFILRMTIKELGLSDSVLESLANCLSRSPSEVKARYEVLIKEEKDVSRSKNGDNEETSQTVFDCRLHGCSQDLVLPVDKQPIWSHTDEENVPCGPRCYRSALKLVKGATVSSPGSGDPEDKSNPSSNGFKSHVLTRKKSASSSDRSRLKQCQSESASSNAKSASESSDSETGPRQDGSERVLSPRKTKSAGKSGLRKRNSKRVAERVPVCLRKRQKMMASDSDSIASGSLPSGEMKLRSKLQKENEDATSSQKKLKCPVIGRPSRM